jgi:hypothetical protein
LRGEDEEDDGFRGDPFCWEKERREGEEEGEMEDVLEMSVMIIAWSCFVLFFAGQEVRFVAELFSSTPTTAAPNHEREKREWRKEREAKREGEGGKEISVTPGRRFEHEGEKQC